MGQQAIHSLAIGSIYALLVVGLYLMSVAHRSLYLAYGGLYAIGGYVTWWVIRSHHSLWMAFGGAIILSSLCGMVSYWSMRLHVPQRSETSRLLCGLGLLICLAELYRVGSSTYRLKVITINSHHIAHIGPLMVTDIHWLVFGSTFVLFTIIQGFLTTHSLGRVLQACLDEQPATAYGEALTLPLHPWVCGLGAALAGTGGVLAGLYLNDVYPAMGITITHKILALVLIGALGCLRGVVLAAFALALIEGLILPILYRALLSDVVLLVALATASCFTSQAQRGPQWFSGG
jgi:branched-subunit amino acid ABC-type transport system permease component